jgi:GH15 family glucan-1,4-alpha-glucosidase
MSYLSLKDYGIIGNRLSAALVSRYGGIDWCCLPYLDSPSHFGALLDENRGGSFIIRPKGDYYSEQHYLQRTNVLETRFETPNGRAILTDWMPIRHNSGPEPVIHRTIATVDGQVEFEIQCTPRFDYGAEPGQAEPSGQDGVLFRGSTLNDLALLTGSRPLTIASNGSSAHGLFTLTTGEQAWFSWIWGRHAMSATPPTPADCIDYWHDQAHYCDDNLSQGCLFAGPWHDIVTRSSLVLKLLTSEFSGAPAESITTSIPALHGGSRNWDYRYTWLRNAAFTLQAFLQLGYKKDAEHFFNFVADRIHHDGADNLQSVYTLDGNRHLPERELSFLSGYSGASPVRVGNMSARQFQLDVFGHVMLAASQFQDMTGNFPKRIWPALCDITDYVCHAWRRPDRGPWEVRTKPEHFVMSKVMCWVTLDRAVSLAHRLELPIPSRWTRERNILHKTICEQGFDEKKRSFIRAFGENELDSTTLLMPLVGFLPPDDERILGTIDAVMSQLSDGVLLHRFTLSERLPESDGAHLASSLWLVSCLALTGRLDEAKDRLAEICTYATPLGLLGEQIDPLSGDPAGNFPSAATHIALLNATTYVGIVRSHQEQKSLLLGFNRESQQVA